METKTATTQDTKVVPMNKKQQREAKKAIAATTTTGQTGDVNATAGTSGVPQTAAKSHMVNQDVVNSTLSKGLDIEITLPLGRPINPTSERQKRLAAYEAKKAVAGELKRGRPSNPESQNAIKQAARNERLEKLKAEALAAQNMNQAAGTVVAGVAMVKTEDGKIEPEVIAIAANEIDNTTAE